jgi:hypothetical protein
MAEPTTIEQALNQFRDLINTAIRQDGEKGKEAMIRSSRPIQNLHEAVKSELIKHGVARNRLYPPLGETKPELALTGFFKKKAQDICVKPLGISPKSVLLTEGLLNNETDSFGLDFTEKTLAINVRSQISSLAKNFDTLYERTFAEALNLLYTFFPDFDLNVTTNVDAENQTLINHKCVCGALNRHFCQTRVKGWLIP